MTIASTIRTTPKEKSLIDIFCNACQKPIAGRYITIEVSKTVTVTIEGRARPVEANITMNVDPNCFAEWQYTLVQAHREASR